MKKFLICGFSLLVCLAVGCKKDSQNHKIYLLTQRVIDDRADRKPIDTTTYTYDSSNRITTVTDGSKGNKTSVLITYDSEGRVDIARKLDNNGALVIEFDFFYTPGAKGYYYYGLGHPRDTAVFTFNANSKVTRIQTQHSGYQLFTYDSKGNVATSGGFGQNGSNDLFDNISYAYDNQKNPFSNTAPDNYFFMYVAYPDASTLINNVLVKDGDTYVYTYNSDGYPTKAMVNTGTSVIPIYYTYTVK